MQHFSRGKQLLPHWFIVLIIALGWATTGCDPATGSTLPVVQPLAKYPPNDSSYGAFANIPTQTYDSAMLRQGDQTWLVFPSSNVSITANYPSQCSVQIVGNTASVTLVHPSGSISPYISLPFTVDGSDYTFTLVDRTDWVWPGDANADGRRNMLDLYPIALGVSQTIQDIPPYQNATTPTDTNQLYRRAAHVKTFTWGNKQVNFCHADANGNGYIFKDDIDWTIAKLRPIFSPTFLADQINGYELVATPLLDDFAPFIDPQGDVNLWAPYQIDIENTSLAPTTLDTLIGVIFSRNVTETVDYQVGGTEFLLNSQVFTDPDRDFWRQRYWDEWGMKFNGESCKDAEDKVLDVGLVTGRKITVAAIQANHCNVGICGVTLVDILKTGNLGRDIPIFLHTVNGTLFTLQNGIPTAGSVECSSDTTVYTVDATCKVDLSLRDNPADKGWPLATDSRLPHHSPDIWIRHAADGQTTHQAPAGDTVYAYVRIYNLSCDTAYQASIAVNGARWQGNQWAPPPPFSYQLQSLTIPAWGSAVVHFPVSKVRMNGWTNAALLVTVSHTQDEAPAQPEITIFKHNNVAARLLSLP